MNYICTTLDKKYWDPWGICWIASLKEIAESKSKAIVFDYGLSASVVDILKKSDVEVIPRKFKYNHRFDALTLMLELAQNTPDKFAYYDADVWFQHNPDEVFDFIENSLVFTKNKNLGFFGLDNNCLNNFSYYCRISQYLKEKDVLEKFITCYDSSCRFIDNKFNCIDLPSLEDIDGELCLKNTAQVAIHPFGRLKGMSIKKNILFQERYYDLYKKYSSLKTSQVFKPIPSNQITIHQPIVSIFKRPSKKTLVSAQGEIKRLNLPQEGSFNGSLLNIGEKYLCVYRPNEQKFIGCFLNLDFSIIENSFYEFALDKVSDPRLLLTPDNKILMSYAQSVENQSEYIAANFIMDLNKSSNEIFCGETIRISPESLEQRQKNWILFTYESDIFAISSICPHEVYSVDLTDCKNNKKLYSVNWKSSWFYKRHHRGSTNVVKLPNGNFMSTFHTAALGEGNKVYYDNCAYVFEGKPPFAPLYAGDKTILPAEMAVEPYFRKANEILCVFPMSMILEDNTVKISYGDNDSSVKVLSTTVDEITKTLVRVNTANESSKRKPSISVILHTASDDAFLETHGIRSYFYSLLLNLSYQTFTDFELIYVDAFYEQNKNKFQDFIKQTPFVVKHVPIHKNHRYWFNKNHTFISAAKNTGILHADGDLLVSLDDAEYIPNNLLQKYWGYFNLGFYLLPFHERYKALDICQGVPIFPLVGESYINDHRLEACEKSTLHHQYGSWAYAGSCFSLEDALALNGFNEKMDGSKSLEDCDFGVRLTLLGRKFISDKNCSISIVDHQFYCDDMDKDFFKQSDRQKYEVISTNIMKKPLTNFVAVENYGVLMLAQELNEIKANAYQISEKHLDVIKRETLKYRKFDPLAEDNKYKLDIWLNTPNFDLAQERIDLRNSDEWSW